MQMKKLFEGKELAAAQLKVKRLQALLMQRSTQQKVCMRWSCVTL
jgi:hypothetical protein